MHFSPEHPDFELSPYTGLTRKHWIDAGKYILEGVFRHVNTMDDPVLVPRYETEVTYPNSRTPACGVLRRTCQKLLHCGSAYQH